MYTTGYFSLMVVFKMLCIKVDKNNVSASFAKADDADFVIIRVAKEYGLKVKIAPLIKNFYYLRNELSYTRKFDAHSGGAWESRENATYDLMEDAPGDIRAGMEGSVEIIVGNRTVMECFLEPFEKGLSNSLTES